MERIRRTANLRRMLAPASIAVVGASADPAKAGSQALRSLASFPGRLYPVNPKADTLRGLRCYPSIGSLPEPPDLTVLAVPAERCIEAARAAAAFGAGGMFIISGGFAEAGEAGCARQAELARICASSGLRLLGPNTSGFINTSAGCSATFAPGVERIRRGRIGVVAQSGGVNLTLAFLLDRIGAGVSLAVGLGNAVDVDAADLVEYLTEDENTRCIALHLEGVTDGRRLYDAVRRASRRKPVVALPVGRADVGEFAVSHTGNLLGVHKRTVAALFQAGAVTVGSTEELAQAAVVLSHCRLPPRVKPAVAIVTGQAGPGLIIADVLKVAGVAVPMLTAATLARLEALLPPLTFVRNPVDTGRPGSSFPQIIAAATADPCVDLSLVFALDEPAALEPERALAHARALTDKPIVFATLGMRDMTSVREALRRLAIPMVSSPERLAHAAVVLAQDSVAQHRSQRPNGAGGAASIAAAPLPALDEDGAKRLLESHGVRCPKRLACDDHAQARAALASLGGPVAVKVLSLEVTHKTDAGGVHLAVHDEQDLQRALSKIDEIPSASRKRYLIEEMVANGIELIVGAVRDPSWGVCLTIALGGVLTEVLADSAVRLAPISAPDVHDMLLELKGHALLAGFRGKPAVNLEAVVETVLAVQSIMQTHPDIVELEINPLSVSATHAVALDALAVLQSVAREPA